MCLWLALWIAFGVIFGFFLSLLLIDFLKGKGGVFAVGLYVILPLIFVVNYLVGIHPKLFKITVKLTYKT